MLWENFLWSTSLHWLRVSNYACATHAQWYVLVFSYSKSFFPCIFVIYLIMSPTVKIPTGCQALTSWPSDTGLSGGHSNTRAKATKTMGSAYSKLSFNSPAAQLNIIIDCGRSPKPQSGSVGGIIRHEAITSEISDTEDEYYTPIFLSSEYPRENIVTISDDECQ